MKQVNSRKLINKRDFFILTAFLCFGGLGLAAIRFGFGNDDGKGSHLVAAVYYLGERAFIVNLDDDGVFTLAAALGAMDGTVPQVFFEVSDGAIAFISSDCPDLLCVDMGRQEGDGGFAACLPNRLFFYILYLEPIQQ